MFRWSFCVIASTLFLTFLSCRSIHAEAETKPHKDMPSFSMLRSPEPEAVRIQALDWLKGIGKTGTAGVKSFEQRWTGNCPSNPAGDFGLPQGIAKGEIDMKMFKEYADVWDKLPERERAKARTDLTRGMPAKYRDAVEAYFKQLEKRGTK